MSSIEQWIEVAAPIERVFDSFSAFENFPRWLPNVRDVQRAETHRALLTTGAAAHSRARQWEIEIVASEPAQRFAWRVVSGGTGAEMEATFEETLRGTTLMRVLLGGNPTTGQSRAEEDDANFFGALTAQALAESLARFKTLVEQGAEATPTAQEDDEKTIVVSERAMNHTARRTLNDELPHDAFRAREKQAAMPEQIPAGTSRFAVEAGAIQTPRAGLPVPDAARTAGAFRPARRRSIPPLYLGLAALLTLAVIAILLFTFRQRSERAEGGMETDPVTTASPTIKDREPDDNRRDAAVNSDLLQTEITPDSGERQSSEDTDSRHAAIDERVTTETEQRTELRARLDNWIAATNAQDVDRQMNFYAPVIGRYYQRNNFSRAAIRDDKTLLAARANLVNIEIGEPEVAFAESGRAATMRFRKRYNIEGSRNSRGEVLQELRWAKTNEGWKIIGERDVQVIR